MVVNVSPICHTDVLNPSYHNINVFILGDNIQGNGIRLPQTPLYSRTTFQFFKLPLLSRQNMLFSENVKDLQ